MKFMILQATLAFSVDHDVLQETIGLIIVLNPARPRIGLSELHERLKAQLPPVKWPFLLVYADDLPKNQAGKTLRIGLAKRLGLSTFTDQSPALHRHLEAHIPHSSQAPQDTSGPIPCSLVKVDENVVRQQISAIPRVTEVALAWQGNSLEAFVGADKDLIDPPFVTHHLLGSLPGYAIPSFIHIIDSRTMFPTTSTGQPDFNELRALVGAQSSALMTPEESLVANIIAKLLGIPPANVTSSSDFFLLGGNSLMLGRLAHAIRKEARVDVQISELFSNSTVAGMASIIRSLPSMGGGDESPKRLSRRIC